jgi:hypothetical protein
MMFNIIIFGMSKLEKLIQKFLSKPMDFTYDELRSLLNGLGYKEIKTGRTSGSRVAFFNEQRKHIIRLHKPHPKNILKRYQIDLIEEELRSLEVLK